MKKQAFSYLELIISMSIVVAVIVLAAPFLTHTEKKATDVYGEFRCFLEYSEEAGDYLIYQQQRYNTDTLSAKKLMPDGCEFAKPVGATNFTVTLVGGGGGGSMPLIYEHDENFNKVTEYQKKKTSNVLNSSTVSNVPSSARAYLSNCNSSNCTYTNNGFSITVDGYNEKQMQRVIGAYAGTGGNAGEVLTKTATLAENFGTSGKLIIEKCINAEVPSTSPEKNYCIGAGGRGGVGTSLSSYYALVSAMQDLVHKCKYNTMAYSGIGDGVFDNYDLGNIATALSLGTSDPAYIAAQKCVSSCTTANFDAAYEELSKKVARFSAHRINNYESDGYNGQYTRFRFSQTDNKVARGGAGGKTSQELLKIYPKNGNDRTDYQVSGANYFYSAIGTHGKFDNRVEALAGGAAGNCFCSYNSCEKCDGLISNNIGVGGGGGGIAYKSLYPLDTYTVVSFSNNGNELNKQYDVYSHILEDIPSFKRAEKEDKIQSEEFWAGSGGAGSGGAIIISW